MGRRRLGAAAALAAVLVATACSTAPDDPDAGTTPTASDGATPRPAVPGDGSASDPAGEATPVPRDPTVQSALDPAFALDPPGPRTEPVRVADILLTADDTLPDDVVQQVRDLAGVEAVDTLALANVSLENKVYNVAAVDPAAYRTFTEVGSADLQEQWERVAAGEAAVDDELMKRIPVDDAGYLRLGRDPDTGEALDVVHVGAWAPQVEQVDVVVNAARGEALGMAPGNAMVISTGATAPETLRGPLKRILGDTVAIQNLDAVARFGLDPDVFQNVVFVGAFADAVGVYNYTPIGGGRVQPEASWVAEHISTEVGPILGSVTCNKDLFPQLRAALGEIVQAGLADEINPGEYAGCYYPRFIAGTTKLSNHSFGLAFDINVPGNQRGTVGELDRGVVAIFKRWGFAWGGDWSYTDPMHFELAQIVRPG